MAAPPKILVIDDDAFIVGLIEKTLSKTGYEVLKAYTGEQALSMIKKDIPDLVILDYMMPEMDGLEVCRRLRSQEATSLIPIVMLTAKDYIDDKISGLESGVDDYIVKPFIVKEFVARIRGLVEKGIVQHKRAEQEKLAALEDLVDSVAHEVRNPIVAIGGFARRIKDKTSPGDPLRTYADRIFYEAQRLESMLGQIVKLKTITLSKLGPANPAELVNAAIDDCIALMHDKQIALQRDYASDLPLVRCDAKNLSAAFSHIIVNAVEAMEPGGALTATIALQREVLLIRFSDTGKGIPPGALDLVVRPFYTSKMSGAGMGLTLVKHIVSLHKGELSIASSPGTGTQISITLPIPAGV